MLKLGGGNFGRVFCATGSRGFYGEGYPFHKYWKHFGMDWTNTGFAGKTLTFLPRRGSEFGELGNMPLKEDGVTPKEFNPASIWVDFLRGEMINAVGLSNFGMKFYLRKGYFYKIKKPFFLSIALDATDPSGRQAELRDICELLLRYPFSVPMAIQMNFGCPNSGHDIPDRDEICSLIAYARSALGIPVVINCSAIMPTEVLLEVSRVADGLWIGNTIPFGSKETNGQIDWSSYGKSSPIRRRGIGADGGLSSPKCLPLTIEKVSTLRDSGVSIPIVGGNGIRKKTDLLDLHIAGCDAVFIGSLAVVRPQKMKEVVSFAHEVFE